MSWTVSVIRAVIMIHISHSFNVTIHHLNRRLCGANNHFIWTVAAVRSLEMTGRNCAVSWRDSAVSTPRMNTGNSCKGKGASILTSIPKLFNKLSPLHSCSLNFTFINSWKIPKTYCLLSVKIFANNCPNAHNAFSIDSWRLNAPGFPFNKTHCINIV